ncbi:MAG TPA: two-component regulator propeller domain-containing protein [Bacteroidia bacterium]|jgi:ligand-binding sensor domain-containing protein/two-component sensor histidine kinase|nr:two-component regulator propeller domain-containing protein [Bacteroidia bacterium]
MRYKVILLSSILLFLPLVVNAQYDIRFNHFAEAQGMPDAKVFCICQDYQGYMWFGCEEGLFRYDGNEFVKYLHDKHDTSSVANNSVHCLCEDNKHNLWIGTYNGLSCFNPFTKKFTNYHLDNVSTVSGINTITCLCADSNNILWVGTSGGLFKINTATGIIKNIKYAPSDTLGYNVCDIVKTSSRRLFVLTFTGLLYSDDNGISFKIALAGGWQNGTKFFSRLYLDKNEMLWFGDWGNPHLYEMNSRTLELKQYLLDTIKDFKPHYVAVTIKSFNDSILLIGTLWGGGGTDDGGILFFNTHTGKYIQYKHDENNPLSLAQDHITSIYIDRQHTVWLGTEIGIDNFNLIQLNFHWIKANSWGALSLFAPGINTIAEDKHGMIWIGTYGNGLLGYNPRDKTYSSFKVPESDPRKNALNAIWFIYPCGDTLWIGVQTGLIAFNPVTKKFDTRLNIIPAMEHIQNRSFIAMKKDEKGNFWFATYRNGVYEYSPSTNKLNNWLNNDSLKTIHIPYLIASLEEDAAGNMWIGTYGNGFCCINPYNGNIEWNEQADKQNDILERGSIYDIYSDGNIAMYIATSQSGLMEYTLSDKTWHTYTIKNGLAGNNITRILPDNEGHLWLATTSGLSCFDKKNKTFRNYFTSNGLSSNYFYQGACHTSDNKLFLSDKNTIDYFKPGEILAGYFKLYPAVTALQVQNKDFITDLSREVNLKYTDNVISFSFAAFDFLNEKFDKFAYYLEGFDKDWTYCGNRHFASYTNLPGGDYIFRLKVQNVSGEWIESTSPVIVHFSTAYYKTWWFFLLCGLLLFGMGYLVYYLQLQRKLEADAIRARLARDLHDDIGSALSSISIYSDVVGEKVRASIPEEAEILNKISNTANETMQNMSDIVWSINPDNDDFASILSRMQYFAAQILEAKNIALHFSADKELNSVKLAQNTKHDFYLIFKEAMNNCAKYSEAKNVSVAITLKGHELCLDIKDDGKGFDMDTIKRGNGLSTMKKRAEAMKGKWIFESSTGSGTHLELKINIP